MTTSPSPQLVPPAAVAQPRSARFTWQGVSTVLLLELRQRVRSTRWKVGLIIWFGLIAAVSTLFASFAGPDAGDWMFGFVTMFVLGMGLVVSPTLSSTAINSDRRSGTLAILQVTMLGPADIVVGKLLAGWAAALTFLATGLPFLLWGAAIARVSLFGFVRMLVVLALLLGVVCAIGLACSTLTIRPAGSSVMTYMAVAWLTVVSLVVFVLSSPLVTTDEQVQVLGVPADANATCVWQTQSRNVVHTERTAWLLAMNPYVIVADAAPVNDDGTTMGPLQGIQLAVREAQRGPSDGYDDCWSGNYPDGVTADDFHEFGAGNPLPMWPFGLAANLAVGAGALWLAIRRVRVPYVHLGPGDRVA